MVILGLWDGHDSGAAILQDGRLIAAINEERLTRRKLEVAFPSRAITACLEQCGLAPTEVSHVAVATRDIAKTIARLLPASKEAYYHIRRRRSLPTVGNDLRKRLKYRLTEWPGFFLTDLVNQRWLASVLGRMGFKGITIHLCDHHACHAATAVWFSGFERCTVLTLDGVGDGLSGSAGLMENGVIHTLAAIPSRDSLGIFFEHVTNLLNMRELEDEGKVMALADFAPPLAPADNPMLDLFHVEGMQIKARLHGRALYRRLREILWQTPSEQFAYMAQKTLEDKVLTWVSHVIQATGEGQIALAGGLFANIKVNGLIRALPAVKRCFVFPHMGDGGLAVGAAAWLAKQLVPQETFTPLRNLALGPVFSNDAIREAIGLTSFPVRQVADPAVMAAHLLVDGHVIGWFQGGMEYGPRALGCRSILASAEKKNIRHELNLTLKRRAWYQPFCPSMLEEDAPRLLVDYDGQVNRFMTTIYHFRPELWERFASVAGADGSCRPQMVCGDDGPYYDLLKTVQERTGFGMVLNTSFNLHGEPLVQSPAEAMAVFQKTPLHYLVMGGWIVSR